LDTRGLSFNSYVLSASKFSVDDFEAVGTTPWEGVRNPEARNLMKEMRVGDKVGPPLPISLASVSTSPRFCFITLVAIYQVRV
jgi:hypothetical protein